MNGEDENNNQWMAVIGRSLAFLCLAQADLRDKGLAEQATFLESLGVKRLDIAAMLETSPKTLREVLSRARSRRGRKSAKAKKRR